MCVSARLQKVPSLDVLLRAVTEHLHQQLNSVLNLAEAELNLDLLTTHLPSAGTPGSDPLIG